MSIDQNEQTAFRSECLAICSEITDLTGIHTTVLDIIAKDYLQLPYKESCTLRENGGCLAYNTHLYGAYEAERWDGTYIYYCPRGLTFIAVLLNRDGTAMQYCMIVGPILMMNYDDGFRDPLGESAKTEDIPRRTTREVRSLAGMCNRLALSLAVGPLLPKTERDGIEELLNRIHSPGELDETQYPIRAERDLQENIRIGNREEAHKNLNDLLIFIYGQSHMDVEKIKPYIRELLVLMGRAAIDGGADAGEIIELCRRNIDDINGIHTIEVLNRQITITLYRFMGYVFDFKGIKNQNIIFQINAYIKEHLSEKLTIEQLAKHVYLSKAYLSKIFREELGISIVEYVNGQRVERSKYLLANTDRSILEIVEETGFANQSYFTRVFTKQVGLSPAKYRKTHRNL